MRYGTTRRRFRRPSITLTLALLAGLPPVQADATFQAVISVNLPAPGKGTPARTTLLGNNLEWSGYGDGMLLPGTLDFSPSMLKAAQRLRPTILRYPGGTLSDLYHWKSGIGSLTTRGSSHTLAPPTPEGPPTQTVLMGTAEFLELCEQTGAQPLITVNVITGTAQEAADWVRQTNLDGLKSKISGHRLPRVALWEIGNEPYLQNSHLTPSRDIPPAEFAAKANAFIAAMKVVDPTIKILLPFRNPTWGGNPVTPYSDFNQVVLSALKYSVDYVAIHNAYAPAVLQPDPTLTDEALYLATMAATRAVSADLAATQAVLDAHPKLTGAGMAVTEYGAFFTLGQKTTDSYVSTLTGALYLADVLRVFATTPNVEMAHFWSLAGNWYFGSFDPTDANGNPRPAYWSLFAYRQLLQGVMAPVAVTGPTFNSPAAGLVPAYRDTPTVAAVATLADSTLRLVIINKDATAAADLTIAVAPEHSPAGQIKCLTLSGPSCFAYANKTSFTGGALTAARFPLKLSLGPHAFVLLEMPLK